MKIIVCGGRYYAGKQRLFLVLDRLHSERPITLVIQGGATGADSLAGRWADARGIPCQAYKADWKLHGKAAGMIRNRRMLQEGRPDIVVAFPGGPGTANMVGLSRKAGVEVIEDHGPFLDEAELPGQRFLKSVAQAGPLDVTVLASSTPPRKPPSKA